MNLDLSIDEKVLTDSVRRFVEDHVVEVVREMGPDDPGTRDHWQRTIADAGWSGLAVPEEWGGVDATTLQTGLVFEALGRGPLPPMPLFVQTAAEVVTRTAPRAIQDQLLPGVAEGTSTMLLAGLEAVCGSRRPGVSGSLEGGAWTLDGTIPAVPFAGAADELVVVVAEASDYRLLRVPASRLAGVRPLGGFLRWHDEVVLDGVTVDDSDSWTVDADELVEALERPFVWSAAYAVGGCARVLEMSLEHSRTRVQFGQPIGRFQRVQDHVIAIQNAVDQGRWSWYEAAWRKDTGRTSSTSCHLACAVAADGYWQATNAAHEVHAGIGSDPQFGLAAYTRMARSLLHAFGSPRWHKRRMIEGVLHSRRHALAAGNDDGHG